MITADLHAHTSFSSDSEEPMENALSAMVEKGLKTVCFTAAYRSRLVELREEFRGRIGVLFGVELGLMDYLAPRLREYVGAWNFDFVIGSSHLVGGVDPYYPEYFEKYGDHNGILRYFESILANIRTFDGFDVYGHLDYNVRYCRAKADEILKTLISMGKGIELNTAGLKYGLGWAHPHPEILKRYRELGGEMITVGSDGHKAEHYAWEFDKAEDILRDAGFKYYAVFRGRKPEFVRI